MWITLRPGEGWSQDILLGDSMEWQIRCVKRANGWLWLLSGEFVLLSEGLVCWLFRLRHTGMPPDYQDVRGKAAEWAVGSLCGKRRNGYSS